MEIKELKNQILKMLKEFKSTTEVSEITKLNYYRLRNILNEMEAENLIEKNTIGRYTYWRKK